MCICVYVLSVVCLMICGPFLNANFFALSGKYGYLIEYLNYYLADFLYDIDSEYLNDSFKLRCFSILSGLLIPCMLYMYNNVLQVTTNLLYLECAVCNLSMHVNNDIASLCLADFLKNLL